MKNKFEWGDSSPNFKKGITQEIFEDNCYEKIYPVKPGDVVLDLGASIGPFTWSIMDKASKVYSIEPMSNRCSILRNNTQGYPVEVVKGILYHSDGEVKFNDGCLDDEDEIVRTFTFQTFLKEHNLDRIDFIKTDCEGGEYSLFTEANMPFLLNNVRSIVGEWHLSQKLPELKVEFRYFRDKYLKQFPNYEVYSVDGVNIKWDLWNDNFINYYNEVIIHINNGD